MYNFSRKWTVQSLLGARGDGALPMLRVVNLDEVEAAKNAGIDLMSVTPELILNPRFRDIAPDAFTCPGANFWDVGGPQSYLDWAFPLFEAGADMIYCQGSLASVRGLSEHGIPVCGHVGLVPPKTTWTGGAKAVGKTLDSAKCVWEQCQAYEEAGAFAVEIEVVPQEITALIAERTNLFLISMGGGGAGHAQYLFGSDVLGQTDGHVPRHARKYADFDAELARLHELRVEAMTAFAADVASGSYPGPAESVSAKPDVVDDFRNWLETNA